MKKHLLIAVASLAAVSVSAQSNADIKCQWSKLIDGATSAGDQSTEVCIGRDGGIYWLGTYGSTEAAPDINFGGELLYTGPAYNAGNSQNNNYTLIKTDADGNLVWKVYSNPGDFSNNAGGIVAVEDGVVTFTKVRYTDGMADKNPTLIDGSGNATTFSWEEGDVRCFKMIVTKVSADGAVEWNRLVDFSTEKGPASTRDVWSDVFNVGTCTADAEGNLYVALNLKNPMYVDKADGTKATVNAVNNTSWNGDPQAACGDFVVLSLDKDGFYRGALTLDGTAAVGYGQRVTYNNGHIYAQGYITGDGSTLKAGDVTLTPSKIMSPTIICADTDLDIKWAKSFAGEQVQNKNALQSTDVSVVGSTLWFCGMANLKFTDPEDATKSWASTQGSLREGFIVKLDARTGEWLACRGSREDDWNNPSAIAKTGLTGYMKVFQNVEHPELIYVAGYVMNMNVGVFLREYNAETLEANLESGQNNIVTQGGVPSFQTAAYDGEHCSMYVTARGNKAFKVAGGTDTAAPQSWGILAAKFSLPESMKTAVDDVAVDVENTDAPAEYFDLQGRRVLNPGKGLYIVRRGNQVTKQILN